MSEYTVEDIQHAWQVGFEAGVFYTFGHIEKEKFTDQDLEKFASWIELKRPWKDMGEWLALIQKAQGKERKNG